MKKQSIFLLFILYCCACLQAQNKKLDSLLSALKIIKTDTEQIKCLHEIGWQFYSISNFDTALQYANKAKSEAIRCNFKKGIIAAGNLIGNISLEQGNYHEAMTNLLLGLKTAKDINDKRAVSTEYNNLGNLYKHLGNYPEAQKSFFSALKIREEMDDKVGMASTYNNLGNLYYRQKNFKESLNFQLASLKIKILIGDKKGIASSYLNIGSDYFNLGNDSMALQYFLKSLKMHEALGAKSAIARCHDNIGSLYWEEGNEFLKKGYKDKADMKYKEALKSNFIALKMQEEIGDDVGLANSFLNIGEIYYKESFSSVGTAESIEMLNKAEKYSLQGLGLATQTEELECISVGNKNLSDIYVSVHKPDKALDHYKAYVAAKDSLVNEENTKKMVQNRMQYEFDKKEAVTKEEARIRDLELNRSRLITIILLVLLVFVFIVAWLLIRQNKLRAEQKAIQLEQKLLRSQMNPHFIFNCLQAIGNFIEDKKAVKYLSSFGALTRAVLENSRMESIPLTKEVALLENYLELQRLLHGNQFDYKISVSPSLETENIHIPPMIAQPFIENAIEHGFYDIETGGLIEISFTESDENLVLEIKDNGTGINPNATKKIGSLATTITKERLAIINKGKKHKANFVITEAYPSALRKGVRVNFSLPLS